MKKALPTPKFITTALVFLSLFFNSIIFAQTTKTWLPTAGGNWTTAGNWSPSGQPAAGDNVIINSDQSNPITAIPNISLLSLTVSGTCNFQSDAGLGALRTMTITGFFTLASGETFLCGQPPNTGRLAFTLASGSTGIIAGTFTLQSSSTGGAPEIPFINNGNLSITSTGLIGGVNNNATFTNNSGATLQIANISGITTTGLTGAIQTPGARAYDAGANYIYNGTAAQVTGNGLTQNIPANLTIANIAGVTLSAATTISGNLLISSGTLSTSGSNYNMNIGGNWTNDGGFTSGTSTITFSGASKTIGGTSTTSIGNAAITGTIANSGTLTVSTALSGAGTLTNNGTLNIQGTCSTTTFSNTGTTTITGSGAISTALANFTNVGILNLQGSGTIAGMTNNAGGTVNLNNSGTIASFNNATSTSVFNISDLTVPTITTLTATAVGNIVNYNGADNQTVKITPYNKLYLSGSGVKSFATAVAVAGNLNFSGSATATFNATGNTAGTLTLSGNGQSAGTWGGTGTGATNINTTYFNQPGNPRLNKFLTVSTTTSPCSSGTWLGTTSTNWATASNWCGGALPTATTDVIIPSGIPFQPTIVAGTTAVCRNITINASATLTLANSVTSLLNISGNYTNNGTVTQGAASTITFAGSAAQTIGGSSTTAFSNLTINTATAPITVNSIDKAFSVTGNLTVTRGNLIIQAVDADYIISGDLTVAANGTFTHNVNWDVAGKLLRVSGNIAVDGVYTYPVRSHLQMNGVNKSIQSGANVSSAFSIVTLTNASGTINASGTVKINDNFWCGFGATGGTFATNGQTVTALSALLGSGGIININGGTLNVTGGFTAGFNSGNSTVNLSSGTLNVDVLNIGDGTRTGVFNQTGGIANINANLVINPSCSYICTGSPTINIKGNWTNNGTYTKAAETVTFNGTTPQSINGATIFNNLADTNTNSALTLNALTTVGNVLTIGTGASLNLSTFTHTANTLILGGFGTASGFWGSSSSSPLAAHISNIYFAGTTGRVNVSASSCSVISAVISGTATICNGNSSNFSVAITGGVGPYTVVYAGGTGGTVTNYASGNNISVTPVTTTTYTLVSVTDAFGCTAATLTGSSVITVNPVSVGGAVTGGTTICSGLNSGVLTLSGNTGTVVRWESSVSPFSSWTPIVNTSNTYTSGALTQTTQFRAVVQSGVCAEANSATTTVNINPVSVGGAVTGGTTICSGSNSGVLTLSGNTGTVVRWESSVSPFSSWSPIANTLNTYTSGALTQTTQFRAVVQSGVCSEATSSSATVTIGATTTWTGSWDNGAPTSTMTAVISANYTATANIDACTLTVNNNAVVTIPSGYDVTLNGALTVSSGSFTLENNSNLIQNTNAANTGSIVVKRNSNALSRLDYTMWSTPVSGQQLQAFSPATLADRFYTYNPGTNQYETISPNPVTIDFATGTGYLIRMPNNAVTAPATQIFNGVFTGIPNNGTVSIPVASGTYNAIGNPYPSTIDANLFMSGNGITSPVDALYFWRKINGASGSAYATYTTAGGTASPSSAVPNGTIQVGQGFIAKSTGTTLVFNNTMRVGNNDNQFFKTTTDKSRIWLNLTNTSGFEGQMLLAYMDNATTGIDVGIDGKYFNDSQTALNSIINEQEFVIQGRPLPFVANDVVPLSFKSVAAGTFTIAIDHVDGLFANGQVVYLKDNLTNTTHNLTVAAYTFATAAGVFNSRFEIVFQNTLSVNEITVDENSVIVYHKNGKININSNIAIIDNVKVFDISGRLLIEKSNVNATQLVIDSSKFANQILLLQITTDEGLKVTKKVNNN